MLCRLFYSVHLRSSFCSGQLPILRRLLHKDVEEMTKHEEISILFAGVIGALCFTFSDTFWFSAVEGEVYAMASMFIALMVWLITKWENEYKSRRQREMDHSYFLHYRAFCRSAYDVYAGHSRHMPRCIMPEIIIFRGRVL